MAFKAKDENFSHFTANGQLSSLWLEEELFRVTFFMTNAWLKLDTFEWYCPVCLEVGGNVEVGN